MEPLAAQAERSPDRPLAELLDDVAAFIRRFVVMTDAQSAAVSLWVAHTHAVDAAETTPYLHVCSPEPQCGKTRLGLEVLPLLVAKPLPATNVSEAALFRSIQLRHPTLLLDEVDAIFGPKAKNHEDLRGMLNAGYRRGVPVHRCVGDGAKMRVEEFDVFCPKALVGIGDLPETLADRSLRIRLERRARGERVERFRHRAASELAEPLRTTLHAWAEGALEDLTDARPDLPDDLSDRTQDAVEPLLAIADVAGVAWAERARSAFLAIYSEARDRADVSLATRLLEDVRRAFGDYEALSTSELLAALNADDEAPWSSLHDGRELKARGLSRLLHRYRIEPDTVWLPHHGKTLRGYKREWFEDAWRRYLSSETSGPLGRSNHPGLRLIADPSGPPSPDGSKVAANPHEQTDLTDLTDGTPERAENGGLADVDEAEVERLVERASELGRQA